MARRAALLLSEKMLLLVLFQLCSFRKAMCCAMQSCPGYLTLASGLITLFWGFFLCGVSAGYSSTLLCAEQAVLQFSAFKSTYEHARDG